MRSSSFWRRLFYGVINLLRWALPTLMMAAVVRPRARVRHATDQLRILVTRLDFIGDFLVFAPFLRELRRNYPHALITVLVRPSVVPLAIPCPYVDEVLAVAPSPSRSSSSSYLGYLWAVLGHVKEVTAFTRNNLAGRFDIAIQTCWWADCNFETLITFLSGAPRRVGYSEQTCPERSWSNFAHDYLLTDVLPPGPLQHEVNRNFDVIRYLGGSITSTEPEMWLLEEDQLQADHFLREHRLTGDCTLVAFGVGASGGRRLWPFYDQLIQLLGRDLNFIPLLLAGPGEEKRAAEIAARSDRAIVIQKMPLRAVAAIVSRCALFIGNDSGPMHVASAVRIPVVEISCHPLDGDPEHVNSPVRIGPLAPHSIVVQPKRLIGNCQGGCMEDMPHCIATISPEEVASEAVRLMHRDAISIGAAEACK